MLVEVCLTRLLGLLAGGRRDHRLDGLNAGTKVRRAMNQHSTAQPIILVVVVIVMAVIVSYSLFGELDKVLDIYLKFSDNGVLYIFSFLAVIWIFWAAFLLYVFHLRRKEERGRFLEFIKKLNSDE